MFQQQSFLTVIACLSDKVKDQIALQHISAWPTIVVIHTGSRPIEKDVSLDYIRVAEAFAVCRSLLSKYANCVHQVTLDQVACWK